MGESLSIDPDDGSILLRFPPASLSPRPLERGPLYTKCIPAFLSNPSRAGSRGNGGLRGPACTAADRSIAGSTIHEMANRPGIPRALQRQVLVEAGHRCSIPTCRQTPVEIHHIIP